MLRYLNLSVCVLIDVRQIQASFRHVFSSKKSLEKKLSKNQKNVMTWTDSLTDAGLRDFQKQPMFVSLFSSQFHARRQEKKKYRFGSVV